MTTKDDGGAAFPEFVAEIVFRDESDRIGSDQFVPKGGMSLRDYFAGQALTVAHNELARQMGEGELGGFGWDVAAASAYRIADAMLKARKT